MPVYPLTDGLTNNAVGKAFSYALNKTEFCDDFVPAAIRKQNQSDGV